MYRGKSDGEGRNNFVFEYQREMITCQWFEDTAQNDRIGDPESFQQRKVFKKLI